METLFPLILLVIVIAFAVIITVMNALKTLSAPQKFEFSLIEMIASVFVFGFQMLVVCNAYNEPGNDKVGRIVVWAVYLALSCAGSFLIALDIFRRSDLREPSLERFVIIVITEFLSPLFIIFALPIWLFWRAGLP